MLREKIPAIHFSSFLNTWNYLLHRYSPERKYSYPYYISPEKALLLAKIEYLNPNKVIRYLSNKTVNIDFGQGAAKISEVKPCQ